jgi:N-acetylneuraminate synthase
VSVYIIGEIGINHNGSVDIARKLIDVAAEAGCDAVKFQKRTIEVVYTAAELAAPRESPWGATNGEQKRGLEFSLQQYDEIDTYCRAKGIAWFASSWDLPSQRQMRKYAFAHNKVASAMLTDLAFLEEVAGEGRHTFISTGMATIEAVDRAVAIFAAAKCPITLLHCVSTYPTDNADCNIRMVETLRDRYKVPVGYSGHERGMLPSTLAVMLGATAIERHITLDRTMYGSDQAASLEPGGLKRLVRDIRDIEVVLGDGMKRFLDAEKPIAAKLRYFERTE